MSDSSTAGEARIEAEHEVERLLRPDLRGRTAYGAPQLDVPCASTLTRAPTRSPTWSSVPPSKRSRTTSSASTAIPTASSPTCARR